MDFSKLKTKALELKDKAVEITNKTVDATAKKVGESSLVLKIQLDFDEFILKSETKTFTNQAGETKIFEKRCAVIVGDSEQNFFKEMLFSLPILLTKGFSQNLPIKMIDIKNKDISLEKYQLSEIPAMIIFENKEVYKTIIGEDNMKKIVKSLTLDINKTIEEL